MVGWSTPRRHFSWTTWLELLLGWSPTANAWMMQNVVTIINSPRMRPISRKDYPILRKQLSSELLLALWPGQWPLGLLHPTHQNTETITIGNTFDQSLGLATIPRLHGSRWHLNVDQDLVTEVKAKFDKLKPLHINKRRTHQNGEEDSPQSTNEGIENHHRHVSHLVGLFPGMLLARPGWIFQSCARAPSTTVEMVV